METVQVTIYQLPAEHKMMFQGSNEWYDAYSEYKSKGALKNEKENWIDSGTVHDDFGNRLWQTK